LFGEGGEESGDGPVHRGVGARVLEFLMNESKGKRGGRRKGTIIHYVDPVLKIMRKVSRTRRQAGEDGLLRMYRDLQDDNPEKFLAQLSKLEGEHTKSINEHKMKAGRMGGDLGSAKCIALVEELLDRLKAKEVK